MTKRLHGPWALGGRAVEADLLAGRWCSQKQRTCFTHWSTPFADLKLSVQLISGALSHRNPGNQFGHVAPIVNIIFTALTAVLQIVCLNRGLKVYESTLVVPVFYGVYTATGFLNSLIFNNEVNSYESWTLFLIFLSIFVLVSGVVLLTHKKPEPVVAKTKGAATPRSAMAVEERRRRKRADKTRSQGAASDEENLREQGDGENDTLWAIGEASSDEDDDNDDDIDHHLNPANQSTLSAKPQLQRRGSSSAGVGNSSRKRSGSYQGSSRGEPSESSKLIGAHDDDGDADVESGDGFEPSTGAGTGKGKARAKMATRRRSMDPFYDDGAESSELEVFGLAKSKNR